MQKMIRAFYSLKQKLCEFKRKDVKNGIPIFMVHHVNQYPRPEEANLTIRTDEFKMFIKNLIKNEYCFIKPEQLESSFGKQACMITFDDVCCDAMQNAIPYLEENHIPYVCFISPVFIGKKGYIDRIDLQFLNDSKYCTIGAHGINHKLFRNLTKQQKIEELSRERHEELLGCTIHDFAFPYGSYFACDMQSIIRACKEYRRVYTTLSYKAISDDLYFFLPRINLNSTYVSRN